MWFQKRVCGAALFSDDDRKTWRIRDNQEAFAAVFIELSKAFDCISHELLIAKLNAYGFDIKSLNFILTYFTNQK